MAVVPSRSDVLKQGICKAFKLAGLVLTTKKEEILAKQAFLALVFVFFYYNFYYSLIIKII
ncbi:hypothetical protein, partial [Treponema phagedenis]|uniref:hypothetical protein n=1 Tax=Treponema phagedenis TaxID=162 RepID=UPI003139D14E